jgi:GntR family transcriptional regulator/MocR family aminotransferase
MPLELFAFDQRSATPRYSQLYEEIRQAILGGRLSPGTLLPSSRRLSGQLAVARGTVVLAYELLASEGYVESRPGAGIFVAPVLPDDLTRAPRARPEHPSPPDRRPRLSQRGGRLTAAQPNHARGPAGEPFQMAFADLDAFPVKTWTAITTRRYRQGNRALLLAADPGGYRPLREAISAYLIASRSVRCSAEQVFILPSYQAASDLLARLLLDPGDPVWLEEPSGSPIWNPFVLAGAEIVPVPVDEEGIDVAAGMAVCPDARLAYVAPSNHYPLGMTLSLSRRLALLDWARRANAWVIEDDHDGEFRYSGRPLPALQGLDQSGQVIYLSSFFKVLYPGMTLGYIVVPEQLADDLQRVEALAHLQPPLIEQAILADFIHEGHFARHIRRLREVYAERQAFFIETVERELGGLLTIQARPSGMHLVGWLADGLNEERVAEQAAGQGVNVLPLRRNWFGEQPANRRGLALGYAGFSEDRIVTGVRALAACLREQIGPR